MTTSRYGSMSETEYDLIDRTLDKIKATFGEVRFLEVGVCGGGTVAGVARRCKQIGAPLFASGVDCLEHYKPDRNLFPELPADYKFYVGDSMDQWRNITDKFNFLLVDGCHCVVHATADFLNYSPLVVVGGYVVFHDTAVPKGQHEQMAFPQDHSLAGKDPGKLGVREGLKKLGLLQGYRADWELVEEVPSDSGVMGAILYRKVKDL
jgi:hypothetical protein